MATTGHLGSVVVTTIVYTREIALSQLWTDFSLCDLVGEAGTTAWISGVGGEQRGLVGVGEIARENFTGRERFSRAQRWWSDVLQTVSHEGGHDQSLTAFMSFSFSPDQSDSVVVVPETLIRRVSEGIVITTAQQLVAANPMEFLETIRAHTSASQHTSVQWRDGSHALSTWQARVSDAVGRIESGALDKVVLARSIIGECDAPVNIGWVLHRLNSAYPSCWTFFVDGWLGATPELLVSRTGDIVHSRVLAGTMKRSTDQFLDGDLAAQLRDSAKDLAEHEYAVRSVADVLSAHCTDLAVPAEPSILQLANVQHLATDVQGSLADDVPAVALAGSLHPTAAVCGTPTERAAALITELEAMDRQRYAAPIGWSDANGDGEYGIALRCAHIRDESRTSFELFAGCGIVAGSTPESERVESEAKLQAMRRALTP